MATKKTVKASDNLVDIVSVPAAKDAEEIVLIKTPEEKIKEQSAYERVITSDEKEAVDFVITRYESMRRKRSKVDRNWPVYQKQFEAIFIPYADGRSRSNVPLEYIIIENLVSEAIQRKTNYTIESTTSGTAFQEKAVKKVWDWDWTHYDREVEAIKNEYTCGIFGTSVTFNGFEIDRRIINDPSIDNGELVYKKKWKIDSHVTLKNVDIRYFYPDDRVSDFNDAADCVYRRYVTKEYVQQLRNNPFYDIPEKITTSYRKDVVYYNNEERYDVGDVIEILEYYNKEADEVIFIMDRKHIIRRHPLPYAHKELPFTMRQLSFNPNSLWGRGFCEILTSYKSELNNLKEMIMDAVRRSNNSMFVMGGDLSFDSEQPGFNNTFIRINGQLQGNFQEITGNPPNAAIFQYLQELYTDIAIATGIDPKNILGEPSSTAFETAVKQESSMKRVNVMFKNRDIAFQRMAKQHLANIMQFYPVKMARGIVDMGKENADESKKFPSIPLKDEKAVGSSTFKKEPGTWPFELTPERVRGNFDISVKTNLNAPTLRQLERENMKDFANSAAMIQQAAAMNPLLAPKVEEMTKDLAFKYGIDLNFSSSEDQAVKEQKEQLLDIPNILSGLNDKAMPGVGEAVPPNPNEPQFDVGAAGDMTPGAPGVQPPGNPVKAVLARK